jgi:hypothetical protein
MANSVSATGRQTAGLRFDARVLPFAAAALSLAALVFFPLLALWLGKEAAWDFQNYHWYAPYALLNGRRLFDVAVGHHATYYAPLLDLPLWWIANAGPAWWGGVWLGLHAGVAAILVGAIAWMVLPLHDARLRLGLAALLGFFGVLGGGTLSQIGSTSNDIIVDLPVLASLLVLLLAANCKRASLLTLAGVLCGIAVGFKLTTGIYAVGGVAALLTLDTSWRGRLRAVLLFGIGGAIGAAISGGYWWYALWHETGNPLFPFANTIFKSTLIKIADYSDPNFRPRDWLHRIFFPFFFTANSRQVAEWDFRDVRILVAYMLAFALLVLALRRRVSDDPLADRARGRMLLAALAGAYLPWAFVFGIYRYALPIEMLSLVAIAILIGWMPAPRHARIATVALLALVTQSLVTATFERLDWTGRYVEAQLPAIEPDAMVLGVGKYPFAYLIPFAPPTVPWLRIDGWLVGPKDGTGLATMMEQRVAAQRGPLYVIFAAWERNDRDRALAAYGLAADDAACTTVTSNIGRPLAFCRVVRKGSP